MLSNMLLITVVCFLMYGKIIFNEPIVDDIQRLKKKRKFVKPSQWADFFYGAGSFKNEYLDRAFTIVLFTSICLLIYKAFGSNEISFLASLLYALNPINNQISMWRNGRRYQVVIIISLIIINNWKLFFLYLAVPFLQVTAIPLPFVFIKNPLVALVSAMGITLFVVATWDRTSFGSFFKHRFKKIPHGEKLRIKPQKFIVMVKTLGFYLINSIIPTTKFMYYDYLQLYDLTKEGTDEAYRINCDFVFKLCLLLCFIGYGAYVRGFIGWCVYCWFIFTLPWSNIITITQTFTDRYCSLPAVFGMIVLANAIIDYPLIITAILIVYAMVNILQMNMYREAESFLRFHTYYLPKSIDARSYWAVNLIANKDMLEAYSLLRYGYRHFPDNYKFNILLAKISSVIKPDQCHYFLDKSEKHMYINEVDRCTKEINHLRKQLAKRGVK